MCFHAVSVVINHLRVHIFLTGYFSQIKYVFSVFLSFWPGSRSRWSTWDARLALARPWRQRHRCHRPLSSRRTKKKKMNKNILLFSDHWPVHKRRGWSGWRAAASPCLGPGRRVYVELRTASILSFRLRTNCCSTWKIIRWLVFKLKLWVQFNERHKLIIAPKLSSRAGSCGRGGNMSF